LVYALDEETQEIAFLASPDAQTLRRIWEDLRKDAPAEAKPEPSGQDPGQVLEGTDLGGDDA
jgi:hypothetical protein